MVFANVWQKAAGWSAEEEFTRIRIFSTDDVTQKSNGSKRWRRERLKELHNIWYYPIFQTNYARFKCISIGTFLCKIFKDSSIAFKFIHTLLIYHIRS